MEDSLPIFRIASFKFFFCFGILFLHSQKSFAKKKIINVVLDAGHGGMDSGAVGKFSKEKNIALKVTLELGKVLQSEKNIKIIYTRDKDIFFEQHKRSKIAREKADLFISIHCNSAKSPKVNGVEAYIMAVGQLTESSEAAKRENQVIKLEKKYDEIYSNISKENCAHILYAIQCRSNYDASLKLGNSIITELSKTLKMKNRGVKQDRLILFYRILVPSVLIEIGYISNIEEEKKLNNIEKIKKIAEAIASAILNFREKHYKNL